jgi:hypothetical protein
VRSEPDLLGPSYALVSCVPSGLGRLCAEPNGWAKRSTTRVCRIPLAVAATAHSPCRAILPEPRAAPIDGPGCPQARGAPRAFLCRPSSPHELRMGLRMGTMQAPRWQRRANAHRPFWHVQARHHGGLLGGPIHGKLPCLTSILLFVLSSPVLERRLCAKKPFISSPRWGHAPIPFLVFLVHRIHGIRGIAVWRASADAEQEPRCAAQSDLALARIPPLAARRSGRVGRSGRSARGSAIQAIIARGPVARVPSARAGCRARPRDRRDTGARAGPSGRYFLSSVSRAGANHGRICQAYSRDPDQGSGECPSNNHHTSFFLFLGLSKATVLFLPFSFFFFPLSFSFFTGAFFLG